MKKENPAPQSRSSQLRSHRTQQSQQRSTRAAERARRPVATPPVMARGSMAGVGARKRTGALKQSVRPRRFYSLKTTGAEVRIPALPVLQFGWRLASFALAVVCGLALWAMASSSMFQVDQIRIVGSKRLSAQEVNQALDLQGVPVIRIVPAEIKEEVLTAFPDFSSAEVEVGLPAGLVVQVVERQPVLAWQQGDQLKWIDEEGMAFPARGEMPDLMTIQGEGDPPGPAEPADAEGTNTPTGTVVLPSDQKPKRFIDPALIESILKLAGQPPAGTPVLYNPKYGLGWNDPGGWKVYFGTKVDDMDLKLQQYRVIVDSLSMQNIHPVLISVEFAHAPFYRLEQ